MKSYTVYVYHWPAKGGDRDLWLGYTTLQGISKSMVGKVLVEAETRTRAITEAIKRVRNPIL